MEFQRKVNLLDNKPNQPSTFETKNKVEINDGLYRTYITGSQFKFIF